MGLNLDLVRMFGLPTRANCPHCNELADLYFDDFDIECGEPKRGVVKLTTECCHCEKEFAVSCKLALVETTVSTKV